MDGLFSHASEPEHPSGLHPSAPQDWLLELPCSLVQAAEGFLDYLHLWWPLGLYSVGGAGGQLWWDRDCLMEETPSGDQVVWGGTEVWDPPLTMSVELALPGAENDRWVVSMTPQATSTTVELRAPLPRKNPHDASPPEADFWGTVLGYYGRFMGAAVDPEQR
jgi:hypothetical protein